MVIILENVDLGFNARIFVHSVEKNESDYKNILVKWSELGKGEIELKLALLSTMKSACTSEAKSSWETWRIILS